MDALKKARLHRKVATAIFLILNRLRQDGDVEKEIISPNFLTRNWPPAFTEWSTKSVRDMFFASPQFPRLLNAEVIKETIARGVGSGLFAYVGKTQHGAYEPLFFGQELPATDVELSDDMYIIPAEEAKQCIEPPRLVSVVISPQGVSIVAGKKQTFMVRGLDQHNREIAVSEMRWNATGGTIDESGVFLAGNLEGSRRETSTTGADCSPCRDGSAWIRDNPVRLDL